jgi:hydrogenase 3 maturation protease
MPTIKSQLKSFLTGRVCVLGFGNRMWRDDGVGSRIAEALQECEGLNAIDGGFVPENHLERVVQVQPDSILMIDAADFGGSPGETRLFMQGDIAISGLSTHAGSPAMLAKYLEARTGGQAGLLAIQPGDTQEGAELSPEVAEFSYYLVKELCLMFGRSPFQPT